MSREDAEIAVNTRDLDLVHLLFDDRAVGNDDLKLDAGGESHQPFIFSAFSTASSIVPTM